MRKYVLLVVVLAIVAAVAVVAFQTDRTGPTQLIKDKKLINKTVVAFVRNPYKDNYDISRIAGYIDNRGAAKVARAHLEIQLLDSKGNRKELVKYDITDIPAYSRRSFDANAGDLSGDRKAVAKITEIEVAK